MPAGVTVVLHQPERATNIGACARAIKNCGIIDLRLVNPLPRKLDAAYRMATNAADVLDNAKTFGTLGAALSDSTLSFAVTRRGDLSDASVMTPRTAAEFIAESAGTGRVALVFGPEHRGLSNAEIGLCSRIITIPSSPDCPSLNLSHAVMVVCHEIFSTGFTRPEEGAGDRRSEPPQSSEIEELIAHMQRTLLRIGFLKEQNPGRLNPVMRSFLVRAGATLRELRMMRGILAQIDWVAGKAGIGGGKCR
jgi:tRNA/rRNA methyltransferase